MLLLDYGVSKAALHFLKITPLGIVQIMHSGAALKGRLLLSGSVSASRIKKVTIGYCTRGLMLADTLYSRESGGIVIIYLMGVDYTKRVESHQVMNVII